MLGIATIDFETYSEAGYLWEKSKRLPLYGTKRGLEAVGVAVYSQHLTTQVLSLAYDLHEGEGEQLWISTMPPPMPLFAHILGGGLVEAHNASFEWHIWKYVCVERMGWIPLPLEQMRDSMAKARAWGLPASLGSIAEVLGGEQKDKEGQRLLQRFSIPQNPYTRILPEDDPIDALKLYAYNIQDVRAEASISSKIPDLIPFELEFWMNTQRSNYRGVAVDLEAVEDCIAVLEQALPAYNEELESVTNGEVAKASQVTRLLNWCKGRGLDITSLDSTNIEEALSKPLLPPDVRRALEIRQLVGSAGVKKVYAMKHQADREKRLKNLFNYHGARTGRATASDVQPQNLVKAGVQVKQCPHCSEWAGAKLDWCIFCGGSLLEVEAQKWTHAATDSVLRVIATRDLRHIERVYGDVVLAISGCIRGLFISPMNHDLICSDYSSIEAVVTAVLSGEEWRIEAFQRQEDIYLRSASMITGTPMGEYLKYGKKHPDRQKIGKPAELGLGFGGWVGAWRQFDKTPTFTDEQVKANIIAWREASPAIVEMWGGQLRGLPWSPTRREYFGLEGMAIQATLNPGSPYHYRGIMYQVRDDVLYAKLPSGRELAYHRPRCVRVLKYEQPIYQLSYAGWNTNPKMGARGWQRIETYGGRLMENVVQAVARDIMAHATNTLERRGYPVVLQVHDELVAEVPEGWGSVEEFEALMVDLPDWAREYPIRASGGWRARRYQKGD